jgi:hypothetical protein
VTRAVTTTTRLAARSEEPEKYITNEVLHSMISEAEQATDVRLVGPDASGEED